MADTLPAWSFSALSTYESCPYRAKLEKLDKVPQLPRPLPESGEHANDRGERIHNAAEAFVKNEANLAPELRKFQEEFTNLQTRYIQGTVSLEHMWCFDNAWKPIPHTDYRHTWLRVKLDAMVFLTPEVGAVIDYKTGKKFGNEIKHAQQAQLYQLAAFIKYPQLQEVHTELWYLDKDEISKMRYTRTQGLRFYRNFQDRAVAMTTDTTFKPKPNGHSCRFCPYAPAEFSNKWVNKNGACEHGVA